jgi:hypothetical protein
MLTSIFHLWHKLMFSRVFLNFPFPETRNLTSQKINFNICSSFLGWLPNFISFLVLQRPYTAELNISLHIDPIKDLVFQVLHPSSIKPSQLVGGFKASQRCKQVFQIRELNPHEKNKWSRLSVPFLQKTQFVSPS